MAHWTEDTEEVQRAKKLAAGPLGRAIFSMPSRFVEPAIFGALASGNLPPTVNNGSASLVRLGDREFAITCAHVVDEFQARSRAEPGRNYAFQIGNVGVPIDERLVDIDEHLDVAVIDIEGLHGQHASTRGGHFNFHEPHRWPPEPVRVGEFVSFAGFPGVGRQPPVGRHIDFDSAALGGQPVTVAEYTRIVCQLERENWVHSYGPQSLDMKSLGGMSGGLAMVDRGLHFAAAGIVSQFSPEFDLIYLIPLTCIALDGSIVASE